MTPSQTQAIEWFKNFCAPKSTKYGAAITNWKAEETDHGAVWVSFQIEMLNLESNDILRAVSHQYWLALVGKRGAISIYMGPKEVMDQFKGKRWCGMKVKG